MSYPKKLLRIAPARGLASDVATFEAPAEFFTRMRNAICRQGFAENAPPFSPIYAAPLTPALDVLNVPTPDVNYWAYASASALHIVESTVHTPITPVAGLSAAPLASDWSSGLLNGVPFWSNGKDAPIYWALAPSARALPLPGWPASTVCKFIAAYKFHLFAFNIDGPAGAFPMLMQWSDAAEPGAVPSSWTPAPDNQAGSASLSATPGAILTAAQLRDSLLVYKPGSTYAVDYVGGNDVFALRVLLSQAGALTRHAVAALSGGRHLVVSDGDILIHDGTNVTSVGEQRTKNFLFRQIDQNNYAELFTVYNRPRSEVWICFPEAGALRPTLALVYDIVHDSFGVRELPELACGAVGVVDDTQPSDTWDASPVTWPNAPTPWNRQSFELATASLVFGSGTSPALYKADQGAQSLTAVLAKEGISFGAPERVKLVKRAHVRIKGASILPFSVRLGSQMAPGGPIAWSAPAAVTPGSGVVNAFAQGRYIAVELSTTTDQPWQLTGVDLEAEMRGYF